MHKLNRHTNTQSGRGSVSGSHSLSYLQISHFKRPDLLFGFHFPRFNQAAHVTRRHQGRVVAEHGARHRVFVTCGGKGKHTFEDLFLNLSQLKAEKHNTVYVLAA